MAKTKKLTIGSQLPDLTVETTAGPLDLGDLKGKKTIIYFYPKDSTPGCTTQGIEFTKLIKDFKKIGYTIFGVSRDSIKSHEKFKEKQCFEFDLISDPDEKLCKAFDVIHEKNMYGKKVLGIVRSTFIIDEKGKISHEMRGIKAQGHAAEVLSVLKGK